MTLCYLVVLALPGVLGDRTVIGAVVLLHVVFVLAPPLLSADVMGYIEYARLGATHGLNPYSDLPLSVPSDPVYRYFLWRDLTSPYGPLYTLPSYALAPLGVPAALWTLKVVAAGCALGCLALVASIARRLGRPVLPAVAFVGLNPLWLVSGVGGAHNDFVMLLLMLAAVRLTVSGRAAAAGAAVAASAAVKAAGLVILPFVIAGAHERRRALAGAAAGLAAAALVALVFFGPDGIRFVDLVRTQQQLIALHSVPNELGRLLGAGGLTDGIRAVAAVSLALTGLWMLWRAWRGEDWITAAGWTVLAVLVTTAWLLPWYIVWLLPLAALGLSRPLRLASLGLMAFIVLARYEDWFV
jgi:alpha-1,6-mannosyltransferase